MRGIPPMLPPPPPARKRSTSALTASLPPLPKAPRLDVPTTSRGSSERSADHSDADDRHYEEARGGNESPARQSQRTHLEDRQAPGRNQKAVYCAAFKLHFGVPSDGEPYFADFCAIQTGISTGRTVWAESKKLCDDIWRVYGYQKSYFCCLCDRLLANHRAFLDDCSVDRERCPGYSGPSAPSSQDTASSSSSWESWQERLVIDDSSPTFEGGSNVDRSSANDYANAILRTRPLSLADVGELTLRSCDFECEACHQIVTNRLKDPRISLSELKDIQMAVKHLPPSSDTVVQSMQELLLKTCAIATGLATVLDHVLVNTAALKTDVAQTSAHMHLLTPLKLPDDTVLSHLNLTKRWTIAASPPFKEKDLKSLMTHWKIPARTDKRDHVTHCTDFARMYFATCDPVEDVKKYAVRVSGKHAKDPNKMDLPADIRDTLIKCFLDGLKMGQPELDRMPDELAAQPTQFWLDLGPTNEHRRAKLLERQASRDAWISALKSALGRALNNVRQYVKKGSALVPKKKNRRNAND